jgi:hypothetical protein
MLFLKTECFDTTSKVVINYPKLGSQLTDQELSQKFLGNVMNSLQYQWMRKSKENIKETQMTVVSGGQKCF